MSINIRGKLKMNIIFAERLKDLMEEYNLNQVRLAEKVGVRQNTISAWLLKKKEPCIVSLWLLADFFDVDIDYLVGRKDY
jgi:transcriptional regulator with XRE-family HTH domain